VTENALFQLLGALPVHMYAFELFIFVFSGSVLNRFSAVIVPALGASCSTVGNLDLPSAPEATSVCNSKYWNKWNINGDIDLSSVSILVQNGITCTNSCAGYSA
jgi:hypothetical protein